MVGDLLRRPIEVGLRTASLAVRGSLYATERAYTVAGHVVRALVPGAHGGTNGNGQPAASPPRRAPGTPEPSGSPDRFEPSGPPGRSEPSAPRSEPTVADSVPADAGPAAAEAKTEWDPTPVPPAHVSEEPELVEAFAEPGAEDGAGAELRIDEPWEGYARLTAKDVVARVAAVAEPEELAAVQLYEATHRKRETVLTAVERALRIATAERSGADTP